MKKMQKLRYLYLKKIKEMGLAQGKLTEELKSKSIALELLSSDHDELAKWVKSIEQQKEYIPGNNYQSFLFPKTFAKFSTEIMQP